MKHKSKNIVKVAVKDVKPEAKAEQKVVTKTETIVKKAETKVVTNAIEKNGVKVTFYSDEASAKPNKQMLAVSFVYLARLLGLMKDAPSLSLCLSFASVTAGYVNGAKAYTKDAKTNANGVYLRDAMRGLSKHDARNSKWVSNAVGKLAILNDYAKGHLTLSFAAICKDAKLDMKDARKNLLSAIAAERKGGSKDAFLDVVQRAVGA